MSQMDIAGLEDVTDWILCIGLLTNPPPRRRKTNVLERAPTTGNR